MDKLSDEFKFNGDIFWLVLRKNESKMVIRRILKIIFRPFISIYVLGTYPTMQAKNVIKILCRQSLCVSHRCMGTVLHLTWPLPSWYIDEENFVYFLPVYRNIYPRVYTQYLSPKWRDTYSNWLYSFGIQLLQKYLWDKETKVPEEKTQKYKSNKDKSTRGTDTKVPTSVTETKVPEE